MADSKAKGSNAVVKGPVKAPPRGVVRAPGTRTPRVNAKARPGAMPLPIRQDVHAFTPAPVFDRWSADAAGVRAVAYDDNVITMFDVIGEDFWTGGGITAKKVTSQLRAIGDRPVEVHINSPGGDMFEGIAIFNVLREHPQPVTIKVMGYAASAASIIRIDGRLRNIEFVEPVRVAGTLARMNLTVRG